MLQCSSIYDELIIDSWLSAMVITHYFRSIATLPCQLTTIYVTKCSRGIKKSTNLSCSSDHVWNEVFVSWGIHECYQFGFCLKPC